MDKDMGISLTKALKLLGLTACTDERMSSLQMLYQANFGSLSFFR